MSVSRVALTERRVLSRDSGLHQYINIHYYATIAAILIPCIMMVSQSREMGSISQKKIVLLHSINMLTFNFRKNRL